MNADTLSNDSSKTTDDLDGFLRGLDAHQRGHITLLVVLAFVVGMLVGCGPVEEGDEPPPSNGRAIGSEVMRCLDEATGAETVCPRDPVRPNPPAGQGERKGKGVEAPPQILEGDDNAAPIATDEEPADPTMGGDVGDDVDEPEDDQPGAPLVQTL